MIRLLPENAVGSGPAVDDVGRRSVRQGSIAFGAQGARFLLQTIATVVLARLLTPADFGLVSMSAIVMGLAQTFKDAGLSTATIQKDTITKEQIDALVWVNLAVSVVLAAVVALASPLVAGLFHRSELAPMTAALSVSFLIGGLTVQHDALLRRHLMFGPLAVVQVVSQLTTVVVSVVLAVFGMGYWALVGGAISGAVASSALTFNYCPYLPGRPRRGADVTHMLRFGGHLVSFEFINYFARNLDNILIGRFLGAGPLGIYSRAYQLFMLPITQVRTPLSQVALPALSALKAVPDKYRRYYTALVAALGFLTVPISAFCVVEADLIIRVMLGQQWTGATAPFRILAIAGIAQPVASTAGLVMLSLGRADRQLKNGAVNSIVVATAFVIGLPYGITGVATGYTVASLAVIPALLWYGFHGSPIRIRDFASAILAPLLAGIVSIAAGILLLRTFGEDAWVHVVVVIVFIAANVGVGYFHQGTRMLLSIVFREFVPQRSMS